MWKEMLWTLKISLAFVIGGTLIGTTIAYFGVGMALEDAFWKSFCGSVIGSMLPMMRSF